MNTTAKLISAAQGNGNIAVVAQATDNGTIIIIDADGGTRRERGARIGAAVRRMKAAGMIVERTYVGYDEFYGFQTRTTARYRVTLSPVAAGSGVTPANVEELVPAGTVFTFTETINTKYTAGAHYIAQGMSSSGFCLLMQDTRTGRDTHMMADSKFLLSRIRIISAN